MLGKLSWHAIPFDQPIPMAASLLIVVGMLAVLSLVTRKGWWPYLWREWLTSVDHKRIGVMYVLLALVLLLRGFMDAIMMRSQLAIAAGSAQGYLPPEHYDQIFSAHGTIMIFFMAMPFMVGLMNFVVPLQLGVRDVAFPVLNAISFWLTASGALLVNISLVVGEFARTGWLAYPPLSELQFSPGVGVDYYLWALQISGIGTLLAGINMVTTILKLRAPGMTYMRMPVFCWTALCSSMLIVASFPVLTATFGMLLLDRYVGMHFFTNDGGGNFMMYINLIWIWGHPEVYILALPAFGIFSEVIATFSGKPLFGYRSMVMATLAICVLSFLVWLHHFFTMGAGADVNAIFGIASMIIAIPTGVKLFNWLFTLYRGRIRFGVISFWCWLIGFYLAFMPLYAVGLLGMTRRMQHYADVSWQPYLIVAEVGAVVILCGIIATIVQLVVSIRTRESRRDRTGDPWNGRTLEWSTSSPPPAYNFAVLPRVDSLDAFWAMKQRGPAVPAVQYESIEMPRNSANGFVTAFFAVVTGFAMIWHIGWLAVLGLVCAALTLLAFGWVERVEQEVSGEQLANDERVRLRPIDSA